MKIKKKIGPNVSPSVACFSFFFYPRCNASFCPLLPLPALRFGPLHAKHFPSRVGTNFGSNTRGDARFPALLAMRVPRGAHRVTRLSYAANALIIQTLYTAPLHLDEFDKFSIRNQILFVLKRLYRKCRMKLHHRIHHFPSQFLVSLPRSSNFKETNFKKVRSQKLTSLFLSV